MKVYPNNAYMSLNRGGALPKSLYGQFGGRNYWGGGQSKGNLRKYKDMGGHLPPNNLPPPIPPSLLMLVNDKILIIKVVYMV